MDGYEDSPLEDAQDKKEESPEGQRTEPQQPQGQYRGSGAGRKESPFADSPYVINRAYQNENTASDWSENPYSSSSANPSINPDQPKKQKSRGKGLKIAVAVIVAVGLVGGSIAGTAAAVNHSWEKKSAIMEAEFDKKLEALQNQLEKQIDSVDTSGGTSVSGSPVVSGNGLTPGQVYSQNVKSVVAISNQSTTTNIYGQVSETASSGSGFILTEDGYVVSNYHVVEGATTLTVIMYDGTEYEAKLVGYESSNDLALLKIDATGLPTVTTGSSDNLIVGDMVVAIGNPLGELTSTMTVGYISAKDRDVVTEGSTIINMLQTDAAINPGNSGGPLFNMKGEVVGITTAKYSGTTSSGASIEGIGFAIPLDDVIGMLNDLMEHGYVTGAYLGVMVRNMNEETANLYSLPTGAFVDSVSEGSCAEKAGVQAKDIIIRLGDYTVENVTDLTRALRKYDAGDTTTIRVYRAGKELSLTITLDEKPQDTSASENEPSLPGEGEMPSDGSYEDWFRYFSPFFGNGKG